MSAKSLFKKLTLVITLISVTFLSKAQLVPQFTSTPTSGCAPLIVNFTDQTTGSPVSWVWSVAQAPSTVFSQFSVLQNPGYLFINPGVFSIKLVVKDASGAQQTITKTFFISVNASPSVNFLATPSTGCAPLTVNFTNTSIAGSGTIVTTVYDFGDGTGSTANNPQHIYTQPGTYNVTLTITNSVGCTKTITKPNFITVNADVVAAFTTSIPNACSVPVTASFQNQSTGAGVLSYLWNFGDPLSGSNNTSSLQTPTHIYNAAGNYNVTLTTTSSTGCSSTITSTSAVVFGALNANFTLPTTTCIGQAVVITNTSLPTSTAASWTFGAGPNAPLPSTVLNPTVIYNTPGVYTVNLTSTFAGGCTANKAHTITVLPKPIANFTGAPLAACKPPLTVNFNSTSVNAVSYEWHFGDGTPNSTLANPSHTYSNAGVYTDTLIVTSANGCTDTLIKPDHIKIQASTVAINSLPQQGCAPLTWTFSSMVTSVVPITGYQWFSNDVLFSTAITPTNTFPVGNYNIKLVITTAGGCTDTVIVPNGIKSALKPVPNFVATPRVACAFSNVNFQDLSTGTIDEWHWFFGDSTDAFGQNQIHAYNDTGFFTVTLVVGNNGCRDTLKLVNYIYINPPIAVFTTTKNCTNKFIRVFEDHSIGADTYDWDFGDNTAHSTIANPTHTYTAVGVYTVTLTITNITTGCSHFKTEIITIADEQAVFNASLLQICKGASTTFTATSIHTPNFISTYNWTFGDGNVGTGNPISHQYDSAGNFNVKLLITDVNGCKDSLTKNSFVNIYGPTANFAPTALGICLLSNMTFNDLSTTDGTHSIINWTWNYGDVPAQTYTAPPFTHTYAAAGLYNVSLTIVDSYGCISTLVKPNLLTISQPVSAFSTQNTPSCPNVPIVFSNTSTGPGLTYDWDFGDNTTHSTLPNPTHPYANDGLYTVKLTVTDTYGCTAIEEKVAYVQILTPVANFTVNQTVTTCPPLVGLFTNTSINANLYEWDFGTGSGPIAITSLTPTFTFNTPGIFTVKLKVTGAGSCTSTKTQIIEVRGPTGTITYSPLNGCNPLLVNFVGVSPDVVTAINDYNDGTLSLESSNLINSHTYTVPGNYVPKMILKDAAGCTVSIQGLDTIKVKGVAASFVADTLLKCNSGVVNFSNTSLSNELITGYLWDFGDPISGPENTSTDPSPSHNYPGTGIFTPSLIVTTQSLCVNQFSIPLPIKVVKSPEISITQPLNKCVPALMSLIGNLLNADTSSINWKWVFTNPLNTDTIRRQGININNVPFNVATTYTGTLLATNSSGCKDTAYTNLEIYPKPVVNAGTDILICKGTGQVLTATGADSYIWSPAIGLSCIDCPSPTATPDSVKNYIVSGTSLLGCVNTDTVKVSVQYPFNMPDGNNAQMCVGKSKVLTATGALTYEWSPSAGLNTTTGPLVTASPSSTTNYMVIGKDGKNCFTDTAFYSVKVFPIPTVTTNGDKTINIGQTITIIPTISPDVTIATWSPPNGIVSTTSAPAASATVRPNVDVQYKVSVANAGGCTAEALVNIFVICDGANVYIPNTFSPNGDGNNEVFYPRGTGLFGIKNIRIFNRWGEQVFERYNFKANNESAGWDGTFKGQKLMPDVYVYIMDIQCENNSILTYKGNIALIK